jgi:ubiquinone/menaquinone biosynthesis C-methylase UbiE
MDQRLANEIAHGKKLLEGGAESIWNWDSPAGRIRADRRAAYFVSEGRITANDYVLEIGCGTGLFTRKVAAATRCKLIATDLSEELLQMAREKFPEGSFVHDDAMKMQFGNDTFDVVYGSSILHHLEMNKAMKEIFRVLKKGGRIVFAEPNMVNPQILIQKNIPFIKRWLGDSPDETAIQRWSFKKLMEDTGFVNVKVFPYDFLHPIVPKPLIGFVNATGKVVEKIPILKEIAGSVIIYGEK